MTKVDRTKGKILYVVNEAFFFLSHRRALGEAMRDLGHEVHVAAPSHSAWAPEGFDPTSLTELGFTFHDIRLSRRGQNPLHEITTFLDILRLIRRLRPDVVHLLTIKPIMYGGLAARLSQVPLVVSGFTGLGQVFVETTPWARLRRFVVTCLLRLSVGNHGSAVIVQNAEDLQTVSRVMHTPGPRITLIGGSGVDLDEYAYVPIPEGKPIVMLASRLIWDKGVGVFVDAARRLKASGMAARFVLVGATVESNPRSVPRRQLDDWVEEGVVEWWGYREDIVEVLAQCSVFCLPTTYREGVPRVIMEVAAIGRAVITTDIGGCREAVTDGVSGYLCPPFDSDMVANRIRELVSDPALCQRMGLANRRVAEERFDVKKIVAQTIETYMVSPTAPGPE